jgi:hypothetical protein
MVTFHKMSSYTAMIVGIVQEETLDDFLLKAIVESPSNGPWFFLVLPADRYSTRYAVARISGAYNPELIEGLARRISSSPILEGPALEAKREGDESNWSTLEAKREGLQFFEGHHLVMPNVFMVDYGS